MVIVCAPWGDHSAPRMRRRPASSWTPPRTPASGPACGLSCPCRTLASWRGNSPKCWPRWTSRRTRPSCSSSTTTRRSGTSSVIRNAFRPKTRPDTTSRSCARTWTPRPRGAPGNVRWLEMQLLPKFCEILRYH